MQSLLIMPNETLTIDAQGSVPIRPSVACRLADGRPLEANVAHPLDLAAPIAVKNVSGQPGTIEVEQLEPANPETPPETAPKPSS